MRKCRLKFFSMFSKHFHSIQEQEQSFCHLKHLKLIWGRGQHFWAARLGIMFLREWQDNFLFEWLLFRYHVKVELQKLFYFQSISNDPQSLFVFGAYLAKEILSWELHFYLLHSFFLVFHLYLYQQAKEEVVDRLWMHLLFCRVEGLQGQQQEQEEVWGAIYPQS